MKQLIIINQIQFGYNNATYYYCKYLKKDFNIVYICWDHELPKIKMDGVEVAYVSRKGSVPVRTFRFLRVAIGRVNYKEEIIFIKYFKGVSLVLRLLRPWNPIVLDIRTGAVYKNPWRRKFSDARLKFETQFFKNVTVISKSLAEKLGIAHKAHILPLGADVISSKTKTFDGLHLLYVGTLFNRDIHIAVQGFKKFYDKFKGQLPLSFTIIGDGPHNEAQGLKTMVAELGLSEVVKVIGEIPHPELRPYFDACNIGVSYVPMTDYYDCQPVTKTFEYLLSGMPVIATGTVENKTVINNQNGVLIGDTAEDFFSGIKSIFNKKYESDKIRLTSQGYTWENIVQNNLRKYLKNL